VQCLNSLIVNKQPLRSLAIEDDPETCKSLPNESASKLLSEEFWQRVEGFKELLSPIAAAIKASEGNCSLLSTSAQFFKFIERELENFAVTRPCLAEEKKAFDAILKKRRKFCIKRLHLAANLLDPRFMGKDITPEEYVSYYIEIFNLLNLSCDMKLSDLAYKCTFQTCCY